MHGIHGWKIMMHMNSCSDDTDLKTESISLESTSPGAPQPRRHLCCHLCWGAAATMGSGRKSAPRPQLIPPPSARFVYDAPPKMPGMSELIKAARARGRWCAEDCFNTNYLL